MDRQMDVTLPLNLKEARHLLALLNDKSTADPIAADLWERLHKAVMEKGKGRGK